ncbi:MAG: hypothetical protein ACE5FP_01750 [Gemmatimonadota bacterium]
MTTATRRFARWLTGASTFETRAGDLSRSKLTSLLLWRLPLVLIAVGLLWEPFRGILWSGGFGWIGTSCTVNAFRCGRAHCALMGPLFLVLSAVTVAQTVGAVAVGWTTLGLAGVGSVLLSYLPEWLGLQYLGAAPDCEVDGGCC